MRTVTIALAISVSGCAAVFHGGHQDVLFESIPAGSDVRADGKFLGEAPTTAAIDRDRPPNLTVSKPGYAEQHVNLQKKPSTGWFFWDIATCAVPVMLCIPLLVDSISGAWYGYDDLYRVKLDPKPSPATPPPAPPPPPASSATPYGDLGT